MVRVVAASLLTIQAVAGFGGTPVTPATDDVSLLPSSFRMIVNSCGDIAGPTMKSKIEAAGLVMGARSDDMVSCCTHDGG